MQLFIKIVLVILIALPFPCFGALKRSTVLNNTLKVYTDKKDPYSDIGSAVFINKNLILSAGHVCSEGIELIRTRKGSRITGPYAIKYVEGYGKTDLCAITSFRLNSNKLTNIQLGDKIDVIRDAGRRVWYTGYPFGGFILLSGTIIGERVYNRALKGMLDVWIEPGNSGGPVFFANGKLAGIAVAFTNSPANPLAEGHTLFEPVQVIKAFLRKHKIKY